MTLLSSWFPLQLELLLFYHSMEG